MKNGKKRRRFTPFTAGIKPFYSGFRPYKTSFPTVGIIDLGYYEHGLKYVGQVNGASLEEMIDHAFQSFQTLMEEVHEPPGNASDVYGRVEFDIIKCNTIHEWDLLCEAQNNGSSFEELEKILFE